MDINKYFKRINNYIDKIDIAEVTDASEILKECINNKRTIYVAGNGGSMATAIHFAEDLMLQNKPKTKVFSLSSSPCLTAIGNDYDYASVFKKQLEHTMEHGDVLVVISASGDSKNLIEAVNYSNAFGYTIGIIGFDGGVLKDRCKHIIHVSTDDGDYEATEDIHCMICHIIVKYIKEASK